MTGLLVVFAKRPEPGAVKTRLCPPLTPDQAAALYACMLDDVLETSASAARAHGLALGLAVHPPEATAALGRRAPAGTRLLAQRGPDLGARMEGVAAEAFAAGFAPVLLRGSDSPALEPERIGEACAALERRDLVVCPDPDGGYNLVGLRRPAPGLFAHTMSTAHVLDDTRARAKTLGLDAAILPPAFDVDVAADLERLAERRRHGDGFLCRRTLAWLDAHDAWPRHGVGRESAQEP